MQILTKIIVRLLDGSSYTFDTLDDKVDVYGRLVNDAPFLNLFRADKGSVVYFRKSEIKEIWYA